MKNRNSEIKQADVRLYIFIFLLIYFALSIVSVDLKAQGLINNGARIIISGGTNVIVDGGTGNGNFTNQDNGGTGIIENNGTFEVEGNWTNNSAQNVFTANTGIVNLAGTTQSIGGSASTYFNNLNLTVAGAKTLNVNTLVGGGAGPGSGTLQLNAATLDLNSNTLTINNPAAGGITHTSGYIISETNAAFNPSIIQWNCGTSTGTYTFPFGSSNGYTPITATKNSNVNSNLSASTRATATSNNQTWGSGVTHMYSPVIGGTW